MLHSFADSVSLAAHSLSEVEAARLRREAVRNAIVAEIARRGGGRSYRRA